RTDEGAIGKGSPRPNHGQRQHGGNRHQAARALLRRGLFLIFALVGVGIVRIGRIALIVVLAGFEPPIQGIVVARRVVLRLVGVLLRSLVIVLRGRLIALRGRLRWLGCVAVQGMHRRRLLVLRLVIVFLIVFLRQRRR